MVTGPEPVGTGRGGASTDTTLGTIDTGAVRADFPVLGRTVGAGRPLVYLDSAATSQKPQAVLDAELDYYRLHNANVHRSYHQLAREATGLLEAGRARIAAFIGAAPDEIVTTKNASEALNLVAYGLMNAGHSPRELRSLAVGPGDNVVITEMEHHSNLMPWQQLCRHTGAELRWLTITPEGRLDLGELEKIVDSSTRVVAFTHQSNVYGTVNPVDVITARARAVGALTVLDACQSVPHMPVDVAMLGVDFLAFSGHKMYGPTGIGVLWGRPELLAALPPFLTGGEMNDTVTMAHSTYADPPHRFEAGTPVIAQTVGLAAACTYLEGLGRHRVAAHAAALTARALDALAAIDGVRIVGPADTADRGPAISFALRDLAPEEIGEHLDAKGIAIRVGHLCARPACVRFGLPATTRASFAVHTTEGEVDAFAEALAELADPRIHAVPPTAPVRTVLPAPKTAPDAETAAFMDTVFADAAAAANGLAVSLGDRLGLYRAMAGAGPLTPAALAARTGTQELYVREWLHTQVGAGYVRVADGTGNGSGDTYAYELPASHARVLADPDAPTAAIGIYGSLQSLYAVEDRLAECFRTGGGVDWGEYPPQMFRAVARFFRPAYRANIVQKWIPAVEGAHERLTTGATVADIGCGVGYSTLLMAQAYPRSVFHGYDYHRESIDRARIIAEERELDDRTHFHTVAAADLGESHPKADLVTLFNCLHDMGDPLATLRAARRILKPDGVLMLVEPNAGADPTTNTHPIGRLFMALSTTLCLPAAAAQNGPLALGNHAGEEALRCLAREAGFPGWSRVAETPRSAVYALRAEPAGLNLEVAA
ncbi:SufS family cysteine desulfurase [Streptomyces tsukubensis]|uniref:SufS family cysteine desulfurase n=1 Tax=Streptomyces tsukubensis TaxID=83656 RepID=UPI0036CD302B